MSFRQSISATHRLVGKVAVVTASTRGIGLAIARRLGQEGAKVVISSRKPHNIKEAVRQLKADKINVIGCTCHVANPEHRRNLMQETVERHGGIDILVSCARFNPHYGPAFKIFDVNVKSTYFLCKEVTPYMEKKGGGSIVLMGSVQGNLHSNQNILPYSISKTAVIGMVKALSKECSQRNVRINGLQPGIVETAYGPLPCKPEECTGLVAYLVSNDASYLTGEYFSVGGPQYKDYTRNVEDRKVFPFCKLSHL